MCTHSTPGLDPRWPFPVVLILLYSMILFPSVAILAMYAPILASEHDESEFGNAYPFACGALVFSAISALHVICSFGAMIFSSLAPVVVMILGTISALLWGAAIGGSSVFWQKNRSSICDGEWGHDWRCEYGWITLLCSSLAAGASFLIVLTSWHAFLKHIRLPNRDRKWKQASTSVIALGPPSTPPVNLANSRAGRQNEVDSLLDQQGSILETPPRSSNLYNTTQRAEFLAAGGAGKLILPQYLDPTSSGFIPGRLLYGPPIPDPSPGDRKGKGKQRESASSLQDACQQSKETVRRSLLGEELVQEPISYSNRNSTASFGLSAPASMHTRSVPKPLPALPIRIMDSAIVPVTPSPYFAQKPQPPKFVTQHHSYSDTWEKPKSTVQSFVKFPEQESLPPPIPPRHPLRRISSAPPGSLDPHSVPVIPDEEASYYEGLRGAAILKPPRPITDWPAAWHQESVPRVYTAKSVLAEIPSRGPGGGGQAAMYPLTATGSTYTPPRTTTEIPTQSMAGGAKPGVSYHTPRKSSNLTSSFTLADLDTSGVDGESEGQKIGGPSEENSWERGVEELLHRVGYDFQSPSSTLDLSPVASSNALPRSEAPTGAGMVLPANTSEEPKLGPVKREDTFSSEESDESLGLDPEKMDLVEEMVETAIQQAAVASSPATQEMAEVPKSPSLTLPIRNLTHKRSVSSPMPLHIPSTHPVLQLSHGIVTTGTAQPFPHESAANTRNRVVSSESSPSGREFVGTTQPKVTTSNSQQNYRYTTVAPLTITKELPPLPKLPQLQIKPPQFNFNPEPSNNSTPTTPKSLRTPIPDLKTQCVGHFTVSPTGEVEMSAQNPAGAPSPYRGRIESISSTGWNAGQDAVPSPTPPTILKTTERKGGSLELTERLPLAKRKRSKSGPPGTSVRFELSRNEVYAGRTWGSSSEEGSR